MLQLLKKQLIKESLTSSTNQSESGLTNRSKNVSIKPDDQIDITPSKYAREIGL